MVRLTKERRDVRGNRVEQMNDLIAGRIGQNVIQISLLVGQAQRTHPFADASINERFLAWAKLDPALLINKLTELCKSRGIHEATGVTNVNQHTCFCR